MRIDPAELSFARRYFLLTSCIVPRPIAWVGTANETGGHNLAPFSFFNCLSSTPPIIAIGFSGHEDKGMKDTLRNVRRTGELTVSIASDSQAEQVQATAEDLPYGDDEFGTSGLTPKPAERVGAPLVAEAKICMECVLEREITFDGSDSTIILAEIKLLHILDTLIDNRGTVDPHRLKPLGRMAAGRFCSISEVFKVPRDE